MAYCLLVPPQPNDSQPKSPDLQFDKSRARTLGLEPSDTPEMHKAHMWALWHGHRLSPEEMAGMTRPERMRKLDELADRLDPKLAPSPIRLWQADLANRARQAAGTAWLRHQEMMDAWKEMHAAKTSGASSNR